MVLSSGQYWQSSIDFHLNCSFPAGSTVTIVVMQVNMGRKEELLTFLPILLTYNNTPAHHYHTSHILHFASFVCVFYIIISDFGFDWGYLLNDDIICFMQTFITLCFFHIYQHHSHPTPHLSPSSTKTLRYWIMVGSIPNRLTLKSSPIMSLLPPSSIIESKLKGKITSDNAGVFLLR